MTSTEILKEITQPYPTMTATEILKELNENEEAKEKLREFIAGKLNKFQAEAIDAKRALTTYYQAGYLAGAADDPTMEDPRKPGSGSKSTLEQRAIIHAIKYSQSQTQPQK